MIFFIEFTRFNFTAIDSLTSKSRKRETIILKFFFKYKIGTGFVKFCLLDNPYLDLMTLRKLEILVLDLVPTNER